MSQILVDDEIAEGINNLHLKKKEVFNVFHTWDEDYVKHNWHNVEPIQHIEHISSRQKRKRYPKLCFTIVKTLINL